MTYEILRWLGFVCAPLALGGQGGRGVMQNPGFNPNAPGNPSFRPPGANFMMNPGAGVHPSSGAFTMPTSQTQSTQPFAPANGLPPGVGSPRYGMDTAGMGGPPGMPGAGGPDAGLAAGMAPSMPGAGGPDSGDNARMYANGAPPGTPRISDPPFPGDTQPGLFGGPQMDPAAVNAGYSAIMGPGGQGYRGVVPGREGIAAAHVAQAQQRMASQPHTMESGGMGAPSYQGGGYANPGPLAAGAVGLAANGGRAPTVAGGTPWDQIGQMTNNFGNGAAPNGGYYAPDGSHSSGLDPALLQQMQTLRARSGG